jgi:hypothetical protein
MSKSKLLLKLYLSVMLIAGCTELDDPTDVGRDQIIAFDIGRGVIEANGIDTTVLMAHLQGDTPDGSVITFRTDKGIISGVPGTSGASTQELAVKSIGRVARAYLTSVNEVATVRVSATVDKFTADTTIRFMRVYPVEIKLTSNRYQIAADGSSTATLKVQLLQPSDRGVTTINTRVRFTAIDSNQADLPLLEREELSTADGTVTTSIASAEPGKVQIIAFVVDKPELRDTINIIFKPE